MDEHGLSNTACHECLPKKTKVVLVNRRTTHSNNKTEHFSYKGEWANA